MKRLIAGLVLLCAPVVGQAQIAEYKFTNFSTVSNGFNATLLFRNAQTSDAATAYSITSFAWGLSSRVRSYCQSFGYLACGISGDAATHTEGAVQKSKFVAGGTTWEQYDGFGHVHCSDLDPVPNLGCVFAADQNGGQGALGCALPGNGMGVRLYAGRTCVAEGYDGWFALGVGLRWAGRDPVSDPPAPAFDLSDFGASFSTKSLGVSLVPEPATWALMAFGLAAVGVARRKRS